MSEKELLGNGAISTAALEYLNSVTWKSLTVKKGKRGMWIFLIKTKGEVRKELLEDE